MTAPIFQPANWKKKSQRVPESHKLQILNDLSGFALSSMVVSGSPKRWDRWHIIPQLAVYTTYIPLIVLAFWGVICYLPPFRGTRNNHWYHHLKHSVVNEQFAGWKIPPFLMVFTYSLSRFALSSLETTLKNWRNPESPRDDTWQSLGLILSMVTVGANMVDPAFRSIKLFLYPPIWDLSTSGRLPADPAV